MLPIGKNSGFRPLRFFFCFGFWVVFFECWLVWGFSFVLDSGWSMRSPFVHPLFLRGSHLFFGENIPWTNQEHTQKPHAQTTSDVNRLITNCFSLVQVVANSYTARGGDSLVYIPLSSPYMWYGIRATLACKLLDWQVIRNEKGWHWRWSVQVTHGLHESLHATHSQLGQCDNIT